MIEQDVTFTSAGLELAGALAHPDASGPFPGVLLIAGPGPIDRNENHMQLSINAFPHFAERLAERGVATLRYDKRGVGASKGAYLSAGLHDNATDAQRALAFLRGHPLIKGKPVFVLGRSAGALVATMLAGKGVSMAGAILLAGAARTGEETLKWQVQQVARGMKGPNKWIIKLFRIDVVKSQQKRLDKLKQSKEDSYRVQLVANVNARWTREYIAYNPAVDLPKIRVPTLAITGAKDIQANPADLERMAELVKSEFEYHAVPDVTHVLRPDPDDPPSLSSYKDQVQAPPDPRVLNLVADWVSKQVRAAEGTGG